LPYIDNSPGANPVVSAGPRQAGDEAAADRVTDLREHDRNRASLLLQRR
jgi:hypothetical protein